MNSYPKPLGKPYPFEMMKEQPQALDRLDIQFRWAGYGIRVHKFHHTEFDPGKIVPFHKHSDYEFHYIPRGKGKVIIGNEPYLLHEGMMYLTGPGVVHQQESDPLEPMHELCLHIDIVRLDLSPASAGSGDWGGPSEAAEADSCMRMLEQLPARPALDRYRAMDCFLNAYRTWRDNQFGLYTTIKQAIIDILLRTIRAYSELPQPDLPSRDMKSYRFGLASQFIKDNSMSPLTLELVSERIHISPRQLQRIFRELAGCTFSEYVEHIRLARICEQLAHSDETVDDIALKQGYSSANYLHYVFKKKIGLTPIQYRESLRGDIAPNLRIE